METLLVVIFVIGYLAITLEHNLKIDKLIPALAMMAILWAMMAFGIDGFNTWFDSGNHALLENFGAFGHEEKMELMEETLLHHLGKTAEILVFLIGAMTIVEIIDYFDGFSTIKSFRSRNMVLRHWVLHPWSLAGLPIGFTSSIPSTMTHGTQGVFSSLLVKRVCKLVVQWSQ